MNATTKSILPTSKVNSKIITSGGIIHCQWDEEAPITMHGHLPYFSEYLHAGGLFERLVKNCPLEYTSNNAPAVEDVGQYYCPFSVAIAAIVMPEHYMEILFLRKYWE